MGNAVIGVASLLLIAAGLCYFFATMGTGLMQGRRALRPSSTLNGRAKGAGVEDVDFGPMEVYFLVPCLDEEAVIGATLSALLAHPGARVVVVDDASEDRTANVVASFAGQRVVLVRRILPDARLGKGPALNAGLPVIAADAARRGTDPDRVLVCVMDADGVLSEGALDHVVPLFEDPRVGGVQLGVRIINRTANLLTKMQDFEFWGISATSQMGRIGLGTVSLGGNGQFTRLSALLGLAHPPWSSALTEDLDLSVTLMLAGWRLSTTPHASVFQQGIVSLPKLIRQRTRWFQGHMACGRRLGELWRCPTLPNMALLETSAYLLIPWLFVLPWSILFHVALWQMVQTFSNLSAGVLSPDRYSVWATAVIWYLLAFAPSLFAGYVYHRQEARVGRLYAALLGHLLVPFNYVAFISAWRAALRIVLGRKGWDKTVRWAEDGPEPWVFDAGAALLGAPSPALPRFGPSAVGPGGSRRSVATGTLVLDREPRTAGVRPVMVTGRFRLSPATVPAGLPSPPDQGPA